MSVSLDDALRDDWEQTHGSREEITCTDCGATWMVRLFDGEPAEDDSLNCHCTGRGEAL